MDANTIALKMSSRQQWHSSLLLFLLLLITNLRLVQSHGLLTDPRQRGALAVQNRLVETINSSAPLDYFSHFPAGDKSTKKGSGKRSVILHANNNWTPYEPLNPSFHFRAGVCGDELGKEQEHLKGGRYYYPEDDPVRVRTYTQGEVVPFESTIVTHHNGFLEFFICNIDKCGGDISKKCFREGHCQQLFRAPSYCEDGKSEDCGPIDPAYPGRWYLPCGPFPKGEILYGGDKGSMLYKLPEELVCDHCVVQWYWTGANTCNPPGVVEYFDGEHAPKWPDCKGQGGAIGGVTRVQKICEADRFPEEYWQCADVRILPTGVEGNAEDGTSDSPGLIPTDLNGLLNSPNTPDVSNILPGNMGMPQSTPQPLQQQSGDSPFITPDNGGGVMPGAVAPGVGEFGGFRPLGLRRRDETQAEAKPEEVKEDGGDAGNDRDAGRDEERSTGSGENGVMGGVIGAFPGKKRGRFGGIAG